MAVQIPDPGTGNGQTGDNEYVFRKKVRDNFNDQTNAASRLVGPATGNVMQVGAFGVGKGILEANIGWTDFNNVEKDGLRLTGVSATSGMTNVPSGMSGNRVNHISIGHPSYPAGIFTGVNNTFGIYHISGVADIKDSVCILYHSKNTTKEPTTGYLKAASPILHLFNDDLVKEHEAVLQENIVVEKLGVGDYLIKGSTGLSNEGWSLSPPKDIHGNVLCMVEATEADGNINVKTYKRKFDFDIVAIVPDYDQPFDIPLGHSVDLRLNDLTMEV